MSKGKKRFSGSTTLDRFATHRRLVEEIPRIKAAGGYSAVVAAFILWDRCCQYTGEVEMPISRLARLLGVAAAEGAPPDRKTARAALAVLDSLEVIRPACDDTGVAVSGVWVVVHDLKPAVESRAQGDNVRQSV